MRVFRIAAAVSTVAFLSACGGGSSGGGSTTTNPLPPDTSGGVQSQQAVVNAVPANASQSVTVNEFSVPGYPADGSVTVAQDGAVWWGARNTNAPPEYAVALVRMQGSHVTETPFAGSNVPTGSMTSTPNGRVWYAASGSFYYASSGAAQAALGAVIPPVSNTTGWNFGFVKTGSDGNVWQPAYAPPVGQNGCLNQGQPCAPEELAKIDQAATGGSATVFLPPQSSDGQYTQLTAVTAGPDGDMWLGGTNVTNVPTGVGFDRYTTAGVLAGIVPANATVGVMSDVVTGPDHNLWIADWRQNQIVRVTPSGTVTAFPIPTQNSGVSAITAGGDGALWFTEPTSGKVGRITTSGKISEYVLPSSNAEPIQIAGPKTSPGCGNYELWVSEAGTGKIAQLIIKPQ